MLQITSTQQHAPIDFILPHLKLNGTMGSTHRRRKYKNDRYEAPVFLSRFWVSKWRSKILQWHPKFWKPRYGIAFYSSQTIWGKHVFLHVAIATDSCNVIGRYNFLAQKLEGKIVNLVSVNCHAHRLALASYYTAAVLCRMVYETAKAL